MQQVMAKLQTLASRARADEGATMVEYGLIVALIAVVVAVAATTLGVGISSLFVKVAGSL